jgi:hypothetical protein
VDPRSWASGVASGEGILNIEEQKEFINDMTFKILEIKKLLDKVDNAKDVPLIRRMEIQNEVAEQIQDLTTQIQQSVEEEWITDPACKRKMDTEVMPEVTYLTGEVGNFNVSPSTISQKDLESIQTTMEALYRKKEFEECIKRYKILENKLDRQLTESLEMDEKKRPILYRIRELNKQAEVANEFYSSVDIKISGIIYQGEGSVVIVNRRVLKKGEYLQDNLFVDRITEDDVFFNFKGQIFRMKYSKD